MLHHAVMDGEQRAGVAQLLDLLRASTASRLATMAELSRSAVTA